MSQSNRNRRQNNNDKQGKNRKSQPQPRRSPDVASRIGGQGGQPELTSLLETLVNSERPSDVSSLMESESNQDHILGNLKDEEVWERKWDIENNEEFILSMFPPSQSVLQGEVRKMFGLPAPYDAVQPTTLHNIEDTKAAAYSRTTRSRDGWQQKQLNEQVQEIRSFDGSQQEEEGLVDRFLGGDS